MRKIKVLIVDDSAIVREILDKGLSRDPEIEVVGKAPDPYIARDKIIYKEPDVITLDVEMPRMDGIEFLRKLMPQYPLPVIMVSSLTEHGSTLTLDAMEAGALDYVLKPSKKVSMGLNEMMAELITKVKMAAKVNREQLKGNYLVSSPRKTVHTKILKGTTDKIIAIGASTGGTVALRKIITRFPADMTGIVIVQHMPPVFTRQFAESLNAQSLMDVKEVEEGDRIITGRVLVAPGDYHIELKRSGGNYLIHRLQKEKVNGHRPSVDVLFHSVAENAGENAVGVLLTGMGKDGAAGLLAMRNNGARTFSQDEASSVVYGMPKEAFECGGSEKQLSLTAIPDHLISVVNRMKNF